MAILPLFATVFGFLVYPPGALTQVSAESCPQDVEATGEDPGNWTLYNDWSEFLSCNEKPRLFELNASNARDAANSLSSGTASDFRACASFRGEIMAKLRVPWNETLADDEEVLRDIQVSWSGPSADTIPGQAATALREMSAYISINTVENKDYPVSLFAHYGNTAAGIYIGKDVDKAGAAYAVLQEAITRVKKEEISGSFFFQYCEQGKPPSTAIGISVDTGGGETGLAAVLESVASWEQGDCAPALENSDIIAGVNIWLARSANVESETTSTSAVTDTEVPAATSRGSTDAIERPVTSAEGSAIMSEGSATTSEGLATTSEPSVTSSGGLTTPSERSATISETSVTANRSSVVVPTTASSQVTNPTIGVNNSLAAELRLPTPPVKNADGSCAFYYVKPGDTCEAVAGAHDLVADDITRFNEGKTWGFRQCQGMQWGIFICLSEGKPPLPPPEPGVECGPQVPGTQMPTDGTPLADLNPCPLNVCCSQFGYCGTTEEHCEVTGDVLGLSGCLSNCGRGITNNREAPSEFISIGYFEAWSHERPCLNMEINEIDMQSFTHVHFAFGNLTRELEIDMSGDLAEPFQKFMQLEGIKRIMSFGGWADSTDPETSQIWRDAVGSQSSRTLLAQSLVDFVNEYDLDGIDIDWEYPAAPEIPDVSGEPTEGEGYLDLLALLRLLLPRGKSLSIAAPASYWYLRAYPIKDMSDYLDYIVYMTYDLHGQWDAGSASSQPGCTSGDCLRSHVNYTETIDALSMITRAGVPAYKVVVGVTSYGRSFLMAEAGCTGPMCRFLGDKLNSPAKRGACTGEAGIIANAEIDMIIETNPDVETWYDSETMSNYLVYDSVQWVAYMDAETKATRTRLYHALNFGGVSDWAVDLQAFGRNESMSPEVFTEISAGNE